MSVETLDDITGMLEDWDVGRFGAVTLPGIFDFQFVEALEMAGEQPTFLVATDHIAGDTPKIAVAVGDTLDKVERAVGQDKGPYKVRIMQSVEEGQLTLLVLEEQ